MKQRGRLSYLFCLLCLPLMCWGSIVSAQEVYYKDAAGQWARATVHPQTNPQVITFELDPSRLAGGRTVVMLGLDPDVQLDDHAPPRLTGIKLDGRPLPLQAVQDLDWLPAHPRALAAGFRDAANRLDPTTLIVRLNGQRLPADKVRLVLQPDGRGGVVTADLTGAVKSGAPLRNVLEVSLADRSPERLATTVRLTYNHLAQVTGDPQILVDSCFSGYTNTEVLVDGKVPPTDISTVGVTWASEDAAGDHWVVLAWPAARQMTALELHWAYWRGMYWTANSLRVDRWDGQRWVPVKTATDLPQAAHTRLELGEITTDRLRITQPDGQGRPGSGPNMFWLSEITVLGPQ